MRGGLSRLTICAAAAVLAGCGGSGKPAPHGGRGDAGAEGGSAGAPGEPSREIVAMPTSTPAGGGFKPVDVEFMQGMIHHHQQAVTMADWVPDRTQSTSIRLMAERMAVSQQDEMLLMQRVAREARVRIPNDHCATSTRLMPGMLNSSAELDKLEGAHGQGVRPAVPART